MGSGQFGTVEKAVWRWGDLETDVALKSLNSNLVSDLDRVKFWQEAVLMGQFKHPNIISLYGVVSIGEPVSLHVLHVVLNFLYSIGFSLCIGGTHYQNSLFNPC